MELLVQRKTYTKNSTTGIFYINGRDSYYTLEDVCRDLNRDGDLKDTNEAKVHGRTAIPSGRYQVILSFSNRFQKYMPEVLNVAGFAGIRIHSGNKPEDTEGCILVGKTITTDFVGNSRQAFELLMAELKKVEKKEKIYITIQ